MHCEACTTLLSIDLSKSVKNAVWSVNSLNIAQIVHIEGTSINTSALPSIDILTCKKCTVEHECFKYNLQIFHIEDKSVNTVLYLWSLNRLNILQIVHKGRYKYQHCFLLTFQKV